MGPVQNGLKSPSNKYDVWTLIEYSFFYESCKDIFVTTGKIKIQVDWTVDDVMMF
jgi:hypothetical protein